MLNIQIMEILKHFIEAIKGNSCWGWISPFVCDSSTGWCPCCSCGCWLASRPMTSARDCASSNYDPPRSREVPGRPPSQGSIGWTGGLRPRQRVPKSVSPPSPSSTTDQRAQQPSSAARGSNIPPSILISTMMSLPSSWSCVAMLVGTFSWTSPTKGNLPSGW